MSVTTGAIGRLSDVNHAVSGALSGGVWDAGLPLSNLLDQSFVARPARCLTPANLAHSQFQLVLATGVAVTEIALLFHGLTPAAYWQVSFAPPGGSFSAPSYVSGFVQVFPVGPPFNEGLELYPRHAIWSAPNLAAPLLVGAIKIELYDLFSPYIDIGGLWVGAAWAPASNFDRGRVLSLDSRDLVDEAPSGRFFTETRVPRRTMALQWSGLSDREAHRLFDAGTRCGTTRPLLFLPDTSDVIALARDCWPATFADLPSPKFNFSGANDVRATLREIVA